jgi:hypothetical protein
MRRRKVNRRNNFRRQSLPFRSVHNPIAHEFGQRNRIKVLQLAAAALAKVGARRLCVMGAGLNGAIWQDGIARCSTGNMPSAQGYTIAFGGDTDDLFRFVHNKRA